MITKKEYVMRVLRVMGLSPNELEWDEYIAALDDIDDHLKNLRERAVIDKAKDVAQTLQWQSEDALMEENNRLMAEERATTAAKVKADAEARAAEEQQGIEDEAKARTIRAEEAERARVKLGK